MINVASNPLFAFLDGWRFSRLVLALTLAAAACCSHAFEALNDEEMGGVTGQKGILLSMQYYYNSDPSDDGAPLNSGSNICSAPNGSSSLADTDCRFALQLKNREDEWLVFKNGYASLHVNRIALDASLLTDSRGSDTAGPYDYSSWFNQEKFEDVDGTCLLTGSSSGCSGQAAMVAGMAALRLSYPEGTNGGNFDNVRFGMFFEGLAVEPNAGAPGANGWDGNQNGSFMGLNIADNNGHQARIAFGGDFYLYGF